MRAPSQQCDGMGNFLPEDRPLITITIILLHLLQSPPPPAQGRFLYPHRRRPALAAAPHARTHARRIRPAFASRPTHIARSLLSRLLFLLVSSTHRSLSRIVPVYRYCRQLDRTEFLPAGIPVLRTPGDSPCLLLPHADARKTCLSTSHVFILYPRHFHTLSLSHSLSLLRVRSSSPFGLYRNELLNCPYR
ncbi:hypothetical protein PYCCODRAFT_759211 [Trametes coccinea BRFM310]|uniref:Uncharacterized protein n=1 Tax=Trametes coccinea (strain BRFM310) TaxID=1353009 RepID=A0A1Y2J014_TRAC3|nr:hypothetical protein PYCCODRAFT_759211 [Trametes coccinea BRFM310]